MESCLKYKSPLYLVECRFGVVLLAVIQQMVPFVSLGYHTSADRMSSVAISDLAPLRVLQPGVIEVMLAYHCCEFS